MKKISRYLEHLEKNEIKSASQYAIQSLFDLVSFDLMFMQHGLEELKKKAFEMFGVPDIEFKIDNESIALRESIIKYLETEYSFHRNKIWLAQFNTILENYIYKFSKHWLEQRLGILDKCQVSLKEARTLEREDIIDSKIDSYIYDNMLKGDYEQRFIQINKILSASIEIPEGKIEKLNEFYAIRNVIVHSNGIIDRRFKKQVPDFKADIGERLSVNEKYISDLESLVIEIILKFDKKLVEHFPDVKVGDIRKIAEISVKYYYT